jgi:hypothetical protein
MQIFNIFFITIIYSFILVFTSMKQTFIYSHDNEEHPISSSSSYYRRLKILRRFPLGWLELLILGLHPREALSLNIRLQLF